MGQIGSRLGTTFDVPVPAISGSTVIVTGRDPALQLADGVQRADTRVGRFTDTNALLGVKVRATDRPMTVSLRLAVDGRTGVVPRLIEVRQPGGESCLVVVDAARKGPDGRLPFYPVSLVVSTDHVPEDGLLIVELRDATVPGGAEGRWSAGGPVGVQLLRLAFDSEGHDGALQDGVQFPGGVLVVNPARSAEGAFDLNGPIVLRGRLLPPWRRTPAVPVATEPGKGRAAPRADPTARTPRAGPTDGPVGAGKVARRGPIRRLRSSAVSVVARIADRARPVASTVIRRADRMLPDIARRTTTDAFIGWLTGRRGIVATGFVPSDGRTFPIDVVARGADSIELVLPERGREPVVIRLSARSDASRVVRGATRLVLWSMADV